MKMTWRDIATALLAVGGGAIVWAKFYEYSWALVGSWRSATAAIAGVGVVMLLFSAFDTSNRSILNVGEMILGTLTLIAALIGMFVTSSFLFYAVASAIGLLWLVDTARHMRHSLLDDTTTHHHAAVS